MKKTAYILAAALLVGTLAGCSGDKDSGEKDDGKKSQVVYSNETEDTTKEAIAYLRKEIPLYAKYLETRMEYPLTVEAEVVTAEGTLKSAVYINDKDSVCVSTTDAFGVNSRMIYTEKNFYLIEDANKIIYTSEFETNETSEDMVKSNLTKIDAAEVKFMSYASDTASYEGVQYKHESISDGSDVLADYYFDTKTDKLVYMVTPSATTRFLCVENITNNVAFEIPEDYERKDLNEYLKEQEALAAQTSDAVTEQPAE